MKRRNFLSNSILLSTGGIGIGTKRILAKIKPGYTEDNYKSIIYRKLGSTGLKVPIVNMGT